MEQDITTGVSEVEQNLDEKDDVGDGHSLEEEQETKFTDIKDGGVADEEDDPVGKKLEDVSSAFLKHRIEWWESKRWNDYLYKTRELDCLQLPVLNAFLSEWREDEDHDASSVFEKCHQCLKFMEDLKFAIAACPNATQKDLDLWTEGIENIKKTISEKLDFISFTLLKDAERHTNPKTCNMEYCRRDTDEECLVTLCLWANVYRAVRAQGMDTVLGFGFRLPKDIVLEDCAVRLMHTLFDHVTPQTVDDEEDDVTGEEGISEDSGEAPPAEDKATALEEEIIDVEEEDEYDTESAPDTGSEAGKENEKLEENPEDKPTEKDTRDDGATEGASEGAEDSEAGEAISERLVAFDPDLLPPLVEPEIQVVNPGEYFVVGGIFRFDLLVVPTVNSYGSVFTYIYREKPHLRRIRYKRKIVPPRTLDGDTSYSFAVYEKYRFRDELEKAIFVQLQLPKSVVYLGAPEPARLFEDKNGYSKDCIFDTRYSAGNRNISFKTNQFGIFGILQKKYQNFPYKSWDLKGGQDVRLTLEGSCLKIVIQISCRGFRVTSLDPDDSLMFDQLRASWMVAEQLIEKLKSIGINIELGRRADKFVNICMKDPVLEDQVYDSIALLCHQYSFRSFARRTDPGRGEISLEIGLNKEGKEIRLEVRQDGVDEFSEQEESVPEEPEEKSEDETTVTEETEEPPPPQPEDVRKPRYKDLCHFVEEEFAGKASDASTADEFCLIENVRSLLKICRPTSCM